MRRLHLLIALMVLLLVVVMTVIAQSEPMANPECTADQIGNDSDQIGQLYADGQTALEDGDVRTWLDSLRSISRLTSSLRAFCDGYVFEGDAEGQASQVFGPVIFQPGIYTVTATTDGPIIARTEEIDGDCRLSMALNEGDAAEGAQEVFRVEGASCTALLEVSLLREDWRVEFNVVVSAASNPTATANSVAAATERPQVFYPYSRDRYIAAMEDGLEITSDDRDIRGVDLIDNRDTGGERTIVITYVPTERETDAIIDEVMDILRGVYATIDGYGLDLDTVQLTTEDGAGNVVGTITAQVSDLLAWGDRELTSDEVLARLEFVNLAATATASAQP